MKTLVYILFSSGNFGCMVFNLCENNHVTASVNGFAVILMGLSALELMILDIKETK